MTLKLPTFSRRALRAGVALICALAIGPADLFAYALPAPASAQIDAHPMLSADQLSSLVAPIALYPDPLLAQLLAASTYPEELEQLEDWLAQNPNLSGHVLAAAVAAQPWDPSVQAMAAFPDVVMQMTENIDWTTDLGNAVLDQESDVMDAVQRMRERAQTAGYLSSNPQQVIEKKLVDNRTLITIEPASPEIVYVPVYNPAMIWGTPVYPWPRIYYPPSRGVWTGAAIGFGSGVAVGSFWGRGGWGWRPAWGWGRNSISVNRNAVFIRNNSFYRGRTGNRWRHNPTRVGVASRRGRRSGVVATTGRSNVNRRNVNRRNVNRPAGTSGRNRVRQGNVNRPAGTSGRNRVRQGNVNRPAGTSGRNRVRQGNVNRPAGTSGRNSVNRQLRAGTANRANRPIGTAGSFTRGNRGGGGNRNLGGAGRRGGGGGGRGGGGRRR